MSPRALLAGTASAWAVAGIVVVVGSRRPRATIRRVRPVRGARLPAPARGAQVPSVVVHVCDELALPVLPDVALGVWSMLLVAGAIGGALVAGWPGALLLPIAAVLVSAGAWFLGRGRADRLVEGALPAALDAMAAGLRSGSSLRGAIGEGAARATGPLHDDLDRLEARLAAAMPLVDALGGWVRERPIAGVRATAAAISIAHEVGGAGARALDGIAASRRDAAAVARERHALVTQARASAVVVVAAPVVFTAISGAADRDTWHYLTTTVPGLACLAFGIAADLLGGAWMAWLARGRRR